MTGDRPLGVKLVAAYLFLKATALVLAVAFIYEKPGFWQGAKEFIANFDLNLGVMAAPVFAFLDVAVGMGIWSLKKWARTLIILDHSYALCRGIVASALLMGFDRKLLASLASTPYFAINVATCIAILFYLLDPDVKSKFENAGREAHGPRPVE